MYPFSCALSASRRMAAAVLLTALVFTMVGCQSQSSEVLGQAYVAPATLNLRKQLAQKNSTVAVLKHGERVSIIDVRRRFVKIRTNEGAEGWVDSIELLSPAEMDQIRRERQQAALLPSEGAATAYEALNIHLEPDRRSPAFAQLAEYAPVQVLSHRLGPRLSIGRLPSIVVERSLLPSRQHHPERESKHNLPGPPPPPKAPANWEALSAERIDGSESAAERRSEPAPNPVQKQVQDVKKPVVLEDWSLIKTRSNQIGWVLSRNLEMSIPDEVAEYAEGKRITSYFSLGTINDERGVKHDWLWTTASGPISYDFDGWRVFSWNRRRHRFETSYRQHDVEGYFPVHVDPSDSNPAGRRFELITKDDDGKLRRRTFLFDGVRVHLIGKEDYRPERARELRKPSGIDTNQLQARVPHSGFLGREWAALKRRLAVTN